MTKNSSNEAIIWKRRDAVASCLLAGKTQRQICEALADDKIVNPETGAAWSLYTINGDVKAIKAEWRTASKQKVDAHISLMLARTEEMYSALQPGIKKGLPRHVEVALGVLKRQAELLGTDKPTKTEDVSLAKLLKVLEKANLKPSDVFEQMIRKVKARQNVDR